VAIPPNKLLLTVVSPDRKLLEETVDEVILPGSEGYLGALPGHAPLLTSLKIGDVSYRQGERWLHTFIAWGFAEVLPDRVSILAEVGERSEEIDVERAEASRRRAADRLKKATTDVDWERAGASLERALARLLVAGRK
jgi:F-type H+-transporting ATPase subunit epsilon